MRGVLVLELHGHGVGIEAGEDVGEEACGELRRR